MSTGSDPQLQLGLVGLPDAPPPRPTTGRAVVARKSSAAGRPLKSVSPNPQTSAVREGQRWRVVASLHVVCPPSFSAIPFARSWCMCGRDRVAKGRAGVLALVAAHEEHRELCPLLTLMEERAAA
jgi:hypothetical protein